MGSGGDQVFRTGPDSPRDEGRGAGASGAGTEQSHVAQRVYRVAHGRGNASLWILDAGVVTAAWLLGILAGFDGAIPFGVRHTAAIILIPVVTQLLFNRLAGLYGPIWRYASVDEAARVLGAIAAGTVIATLELAWLSDIIGGQVPLLSAPPIAALLILLGCGGIRFQARLFALERQRARTGRVLRTLIVGAGDPGAALAQEFRRQNDTEIRLIGFADDNPRLVGRSVHGLPVLATIDELEQVCNKESIDLVLIALPDAPRDHVQAIVESALKTDAQVKVLHAASDLLSAPLVRSLRDLDVADLLGREHAPVDSEEIAKYLSGATVLVTGAGGSIGSEICRQVARYGPGRLLLLDRDETLLHDTVTGVDGGEVLLADIRDRTRLREIFATCRPDVVFHAAAHKHVPILENHPVEAVMTNVLGTWWLAEIAAEYGARFVHISTDKAVDPCSVMGASKRVAELVVLEVAAERNLPFAAVRFGNVLGSRGSVVPTFFRQIVEGGPVTVTDPEMTRYFMTIPEAVSLVLQAGAMTDEGKGFLLDMGEPVAIMKLARQMIRLAGLRPDVDVKIEFTGARPGERLHERLHDDAETMTPTTHPSIRALTPKVPVDRKTLFFFLELLQRKCAAAEDQIVAALLEQLLRQCGVDCRLQVGAPREVVALESTSRHAVHPVPSVEIDLRGPDLPVRKALPRRRPALLGSDPMFAADLPFSRPTRPTLERVMQRVGPSYERGMLTNGPLVSELEERIAERLGVARVVAVSSCTSGLMLALQALVERRPGPVVLPSFTFSASAHAIRWNGREPLFVDCLADSFQIDAKRAERVLEGASALLATHIFGAPCDPVSVVEIADSMGVPVLFDAAHALGATTDGLPIGGFGAAEVFSLTPTKVLVAGEGGLVATNDAELAERLRIGRDYGNPGDYDTRFAGLNARMSEFHAAMALESLELLDTSLARRREIATLYRRHLEGVPGVAFQSISAGDESSVKDFTIAIDADEFGLTRDELVTVLTAENIETRNYFDPPVHRQYSYRDIVHADLAVTDAVSSSVVSLPIYTDLQDEQIERVAESISTAAVHADALSAILSSRDIDDRSLRLG